MAEAYLELSVGDVCDAVEGFTGDTAAGAALVHVKAGYRRFLDGLNPRTGRAHFWTFLQPLGEITLMATASGTATGVYDAENDQTTITATAAIFYPWMVGLEIVIADVGTLTIASYTSGTVIVASEGEDFEAKAVTIQHSGIYDLPTDFGGLLGEFSYGYSANYASPIISEASPDLILAMWRQDNVPDDTTYYAIVPASFSGSTAQAWKLIVAPRPEVSRVWHYRYLRLAGDITDGSGKFIGGPLYSYTIRQLALAEAELATGHVNGIHHARAADMLIAAIERDKVLFVSDHDEQLSEG